MFIIFAISFLEIRQLYHIIRDHPLLFGTCIIYSTFARFSLAAKILSIHLNFPLLQSFIIHLTFEFQNSPLSKNCIRIRSKVSPKKKKFKIFSQFRIFCRENSFDQNFLVRCLCWANVKTSREPFEEYKEEQDIENTVKNSMMNFISPRTIYISLDISILILRIRKTK